MDGKKPRGGEVGFAGTNQEQNSSLPTGLVKTGAGTWRLSGPCSWNGGTTVEQGTLKIGGSVTCSAATSVESGASIVLQGGTLASDAVNIVSGATMSGNGSIKADLNNNGTITATSGTLAITGNVVN